MKVAFHIAAKLHIAAAFLTAVAWTLHLRLQPKSMIAAALTLRSTLPPYFTLLPICALLRESGLQLDVIICSAAIHACEIRGQWEQA